MRWQETRFRPVWLATALCLWVLIPASSALAYDELASGVGEIYTGGTDQLGGRGPDDNTGGVPGGGFEADPDTFQIDSRVGGSISEVRQPVPQVPGTSGFLSWVRLWLMLVFSGGFLWGGLG